MKRKHVFKSLVLSAVLMYLNELYMFMIFMSPCLLPGGRHPPAF